MLKIQTLNLCRMPHRRNLHAFLLDQPFDDNLAEIPDLNVLRTIKNLLKRFLLDRYRISNTIGGVLSRYKRTSVSKYFRHKFTQKYMWSKQYIRIFMRHVLCNSLVVLWIILCAILNKRMLKNKMWIQVLFKWCNDNR